MAPIQLLVLSSFVSVVLSLVVLLLLRPLMLWYFKLNRIEFLLKEEVRILRIVYREALQEIGAASISDVLFMLPKDLAPAEAEKIKAKSQELKPGQIISFDVKSRELKVWKNRTHFNVMDGDVTQRSIVAIKQES